MNSLLALAEDRLVGVRGEEKPAPHSHEQLVAYAQDLSRTYRELRETQARLESTYISTLAVLAAAIEARDPYLVGHSRSVSSLAASIGQEMGLSYRPAIDPDRASQQIESGSGTQFDPRVAHLLVRIVSPAR